MAANGEDDFDETIFEAGIDAYLADLGIMDDMDPGLFVVSWKLQCATPWVITKTEWMNGWFVLHCCLLFVCFFVW